MSVGGSRPQLTTYNPHRLEHPYGVGILDDLHNVLPEVLYDSQMFAGQPFVGLLQRRVETLFEEEYSRMRANYRLFQLETRRREAGIPLPANLMRGVRGPAATPTAVPVRLTRPVAAANTAARTATIPIYTTISSMLGGGGGSSGGGSSGGGSSGGGSSRGGSIGGEAFLENILTSIFSGLAPATAAAEEESEIPTAAQIGRATILTSVEPSDDVVCSICTDHNPPTPRAGSVGQSAPWSSWRIIQHCGHRFHSRCIDEWFQRSPQCPMCRYDIRGDGGSSSGAQS